MKNTNDNLFGICHRTLFRLIAGLVWVGLAWAASPPGWWADPNPGTPELVYVPGYSEASPTESEARRKAYEAGLRELRTRITDNPADRERVRLIGTDIAFADARRDDRGRWHVWALVSIPRAQFDQALERARAEELAERVRTPVFVSPVAFGRESREQFPEVVAEYTKAGYGNAIWQTVENLLYDRGYEVVTAPTSDTADMLRQILGQFSADEQGDVKLPEKILLCNMNFFQVQTETLVRGRVVRTTTHQAELLLELYEVSAEHRNVKIPAKGEGRDEDLLTATRIAAEKAVEQLTQRIRERR